MLGIELFANDSPLHGTEGNSYTLLQLRQRLIRESENDVALSVGDLKRQGSSKSIKVMGRGDMHLGILFEKMRREGLEFMISPPQIVLKQGVDGTFEPMEKVTIEVDELYEKGIIEKMQSRRGTLSDSQKIIKGKKTTVKLVFNICSRGFIGCRSEILSETRGTAIIRSEFNGFDDYAGEITRNTRGAIISMTEGKTTPFALWDIEKKGQLFIEPGASVYPGLVIGEHTLESDVEMNPCKLKRVTNVRSKVHEEKIILMPARRFNIDEALTYVRDDEVVEITPKSIRIRKRTLDTQVRRKLKKDAKGAEKTMMGK